MSISVINFGCRLNAAESEIMQQHAQKAGLDNLIIINSCAVTAEAVRQSRKAIRRAKRENPMARIIVTGCASQTEISRFAAMPEIDHIIDNSQKTTEGTWQNLSQTSLSEPIPPKIETTHAPLINSNICRTFVEIQNGCDHSCTFCIIPYARGQSRSMPMGELVTNIRDLVHKGYNEIVLTGVDLTSYGADLPATPNLGQLVRRLLKMVPELPRLRLSSLDVAEINADLIDAFAQEHRLMPHAHLSLQSGNDLILKRMKRRHLRNTAINISNQLRMVRPDIVFGSDFIVGFPTESENAFNDTMRIVEEINITHLHVFPFSPRPLTPARLMPQVNNEIINQRAAMLRQLGDKMLNAFLASRAHKTERALVEQNHLARTEHFAWLRLYSPRAVGSIIEATVTSHRDGELFAA